MKRPILITVKLPENSPLSVPVANRKNSRGEHDPAWPEPVRRAEPAGPPDFWLEEQRDFSRSGINE